MKRFIFRSIGALCAAAVVVCSSVTWTAHAQDSRSDKDRWVVVNSTAIDDEGRVLWVGDPDNKHRGPSGLWPRPFGRGYLGVQVLPMTKPLLDHFGVSGEHGVLIANVEPDSPAAEAGLRVGDVLLEVDGEPIKSASFLQQLVSKKDKGTPIELTYARGAKRGSLTATAQHRDVQSFDLASLVNSNVPFDQYAFRVDPEVMSTVQERLQAALQDEELQQRLESWSVRQKTLQERIRQLERQIRNFERELSRIRRDAR